MTTQERAIFAQVGAIAGLIGGLPKQVQAIQVSQTMRRDFLRGADALGLWDDKSKSIVIRRDQLSSLKLFAGTLLHELAHARTGYDDITQEFENELTTLLGMTAAAAVNVAPSHPPAAKRSFWRRLGTANNAKVAYARRDSFKG